MISRAIVFERATSLPTLRPIHTSAHCAELVRRGSMTYRRVPFRIPLSRWWNQIGCASRAFDPHRNTTSVFSASSYEEVDPPAPNTVARPTTLGACHVRLQLSMLLLPKATRASFEARKFTSLLDLEHEKIPIAFWPFLSRLRLNPSAALSSASSHVAWRNAPFSRTSGWVSLA